MKYLVEKARSKEDFDNVNFNPSDGAQYTKEQAINTLQGSNGGNMRSVETGKGYMVSYKKKDNYWLEKALTKDESLKTKKTS